MTSSLAKSKRIIGAHF